VNAVLWAARIADLAEGGEILVSDALRRSIDERAGIEFGISRDVH